MQLFAVAEMQRCCLLEVLRGGLLELQQLPAAVVQLLQALPQFFQILFVGRKALKVLVVYCRVLLLGVKQNLMTLRV